MPKILLIEDEGIIMNLLQEKLEKEGYDVFAAGDGEKGLKMIKEIWSDLILLDIAMPKMSGFDVMEEINKNPTLKRIPIIAMFDSRDSFDLKRAQELGVKDLIIKSEFDLPKMINKVIAQIGR